MKVSTSFPLTGAVLTFPEINDTSADHQYVYAVSELSADRTVTMPLLTGNDTFVFEAHAQSLSAKTLVLPKILDSGADHSYIFAVNDLAANRTITLPLLAGNDVFVFADFIQTLTNKSLTAPTITGAPVVTSTSVSYTGEAKATDTDVIPASVATTDGTVTTIFTKATATSHVYAVRGIVTCQTTDCAKYGAWSVDAFAENNAGTVTQRVSSPVTLLAESDAGFDVTVAISTTNILVRVTGAAATSLRWTARLFVHDGIF